MLGFKQHHASDWQCLLQLAMSVYICRRNQSLINRLFILYNPPVGSEAWQKFCDFHLKLFAFAEDVTEFPSTGKTGEKMNFDEQLGNSF